MRREWKAVFLVFMILTLAGCKERFNPEIASSQSNFLVVEGFINARGITTISLSRTVPLKEIARLNPELNAQVTITGEDNSTYNVRGNGNGTYSSDVLILNNNLKYRLHIKTSSGGEYLSEFVTVKPTPAIDSIGWQLENKGVRIYADTHDQQNNTRYYKWDYEETWEIHSRYVSYVKYQNGSVGERPQSEIQKMYYCWRDEKSSAILLGSSAQLQSDVINEAPIILIPYESDKISVRYSILVRQYSLDRKAYDFYKMMKSNTESLGSVFDPLPSEIAGNISCVSNPREKIIGYITAATVNEKRIFITAGDAKSRYDMYCQSIYVKNNPDSLKDAFGNGQFQPYQADPAAGPALGYFSSTPDCIDCTLRGSSVKPSFW